MKLCQFIGLFIAVPFTAILFDIFPVCGNLLLPTPAYYVFYFVRVTPKPFVGKNTLFSKKVISKANLIAGNIHV